MTVSGRSRRLRILHIDPERNWGGGEAQVLGLLSYLVERGHRNDLLTHPGGRLFQKSQRLEVETMPLVIRNDLDLCPCQSLGGSSGEGITISSTCTQKEPMRSRSGYRTAPRGPDTW